MLQQNHKLKFDNHIKFESQKQIFTAQISQDEQFLAIGGSVKKILIFYLKNKKLIKNLSQDCDVTIIKFSEDSKNLYSGVEKGYLYCYDITKSFEFYNKVKLHSENINNLIILDYQQILTHSTDFIKITDVKQKNQIFMIQYDDYFIQAVDYDKSRDWIIYSDHNKLFFVDRKDGKIQITSQTPHKFRIIQIELFQNSCQLITSCSYNLYLWQIDYENRRLIKVKEFTHRHWNFTPISNNKLVLIGHEQVYIIDNDSITEEQINHQIKNFGLFSNEIIEFIEIYHSLRRKILVSLKEKMNKFTHEISLKQFVNSNSRVFFQKTIVILYIQVFFPRNLGYSLLQNQFKVIIHFPVIMKKKVWDQEIEWVKNVHNNSFFTNLFFVQQI